MSRLDFHVLYFHVMYALSAFPPIPCYEMVSFRPAGEVANRSNRPTSICVLGLCCKNTTDSFAAYTIHNTHAAKVNSRRLRIHKNAIFDTQFPW